MAKILIYSTFKGSERVEITAITQRLNFCSSLFSRQRAIYKTLCSFEKNPSIIRQTNKHQALGLILTEFSIPSVILLNLETVKQTGAILLSIFVFIASINIIVNQHFCNDELESIAFFSKAQPCEHATANNDLPPCHVKKIDSPKKCCSENDVIIEAVDWLKIISSKPHFEFDLLAAPIVEVNTKKLVYTSLSKYSPQKIPKPPDEFETVYVKHQAFLL